MTDNGSTQSYRTQDSAGEPLRTHALSRIVTGDVVGFPAADTVPLGADAAAPESDIPRYFHALRRRWLISTVVALPLAVMTGLGLWYLLPKSYMATATLRVIPSEIPLAFATADAKGIGGQFDTYKKTQRQYLKSRFVIMRALREKDLADIPVIRDHAADPVEWLSKELSVIFPEDSEVMLVSLSASSPDRLHDVVNAIVKAYFDEIIYSEKLRKLDRLNKLEKSEKDQEGELRTKRSHLADLVDKVGSGDTGNLTILQQTVLQQFSAFYQKLSTVQFELMEAQEELQHFEKLQAAGESAWQDLVSENEVAQAMREDRVAKELEARRQDKLQHIQRTRERFASSDRSAPKIDDDMRQVETLDIRLKQRRSEIREELVELRKLSRGAESDALKYRVQRLLAQQERLQREVKERQREATMVGRGSLDVEMLRQEIRAQDEIVANLRAEVQRTKVELQSDASDASWTRVKLLYEAPPARPPDSKTRLAQTGAATLFSLGLPFALFVWLDARRNHIHTANQVAQGLRLSVIGSVPMIPRRVMRRLNGPSKRQQYWRTLLSESVDSIAAIVIRAAQSGGNRVIMVSSATAGEGKTTLAGQLAVSLAGAGHQTLLVDFDLRRPTLHRVFGLSLEPGANEVLRRDAELESAIQPTLIPNLTILTAGRSNQTGLAGLAPADLKALFDRLRSGFDFIVVDASPILPVVDTRLIGQHVDAVLLSVLRDVSRMPKVRAACQFLELFGIPVLGAVVAGSSEEAYTDGHYGPLTETQVV